MNRLITSLVQLALVVPALYCARIVWHEMKEDMKDMWRESHN
jgi:hypothetical protein